MLHGYGLTLSNYDCLRWVTVLANIVLQNMQGNNYVPVDVQKETISTFHLDNTGYSEDTNVTTHALMLVGFQSQDKSRGVENMAPELRN